MQFGSENSTQTSGNGLERSRAATFFFTFLEFCFSKAAAAELFSFFLVSTDWNPDFFLSVTIINHGQGHSL